MDSSVDKIRKLTCLPFKAWIIMMREIITVVMIVGF